MEYPYVIMVNDKPETLFSPRDFEFLLERDMGHDAAEYFRGLCNDYADQVRELEIELSHYDMGDVGGDE